MLDFAKLMNCGVCLRTTSGGIGCVWFSPGKLREYKCGGGIDEAYDEDARTGQ